MSWFGETFGDSLTSLKGQITKITKEVLADDETSNIRDKESEEGLIKELEALCESKDLEISSLRDDFSKLHAQFKSEIEFLKNENRRLRGDGSKNSEVHPSQVPQLDSLEKEVAQLREERNHLNSCLDELQAEHQLNLNQVISIRDKYKAELEDLKKIHNTVQEKLNDALKNQGTNENVVDTKVVEEKDNKICLLKNEIEKLQFQVECDKKQKEESDAALKKEIESNGHLKDQLQKALKETEVLIKDKQKTEEDKETIRSEIEALKNQLILKENENVEIKSKLDDLLKENGNLLQKCQSQEKCQTELADVMKFDVDTQNKLRNLLQMLDVAVDKDINEEPFINALGLIEAKWRDYQKEKEQTTEDMKRFRQNSDLELKKLKEEKGNLHIEMKASVNKWAETEKKYRDEIEDLKSSVSEMKNQQQHCINQSQTDDVKRLEQEVVHLRNLVQTKSNEIVECSKAKNDLEQELGILKSMSVKTEQELTEITKEKERLLDEIKLLKSKESELGSQKHLLEETLKRIESTNLELTQVNGDLKSQVVELERQLADLKIGNDTNQRIQMELETIYSAKTGLENMCAELQKANANLQNESQHLKAQVIIKETNLAEAMKANKILDEERQKLQTEINKWKEAEAELKKWKDASVDLEIQRQDLLKKEEELESECTRLRSELELLAMKDTDIIQLKQANANLVESCNRLHYELESKIQAENVHAMKVHESESKVQKLVEQIAELQEENNELKSRIQKFQEQMKVQMIHSQNFQTSKDEVQQHRRSKSAVDFESTSLVNTQKQVAVESNEDVGLLKQALQNEQAKYRLLQNQFQEISDKEASARKEFERLKQHLIEVEEHYTQEAVENEKVVNDLKSELMNAEEQLKNSSTLYTSVKVRDNQHLESLQSQVRLVSAQRDDLQSKLSSAEDEVQKHKASLMSLQIVLEQFQQDKEREIEAVATKYEKQLQLTHNRFGDFEGEIEGLKKQLSEAKNGLKAASRLGEQLEKKKQQVEELEENLNQLKVKITELETTLAAAQQSNNGKIDKSLIKNLVVGYILSPKADRKSQVLRIMASVLDFDQDERNKMGVDNSNSGWLSNILHPKGGDPSKNQSLSEAFIKFLESESRPQPQLKLIPEQYEANKPKPSSSSPKPPGMFSELMLPTFNSPQESESSVILKNVLKDS